MEIDDNIKREQKILESIGLKQEELGLGSDLINLYFDGNMGDIDLYRDPVLLIRVFQKINSRLKKEYEGPSILYISMGDLCKLTYNQLDSVIQMLRVIINNPSIDKSNMHIVKIGMQIVRSKKLEKSIMRIVKDKGRWTIYEKMVRESRLSN